MPGRCLDRVASCSAGQPGVVEDDPRGAARELTVEGLGKVRQGTPTLVAVEPTIATGHEFVCATALPGARDAHEEDHVRVRSRAPSGRACRAKAAERSGEDLSITCFEVQPRGSGR
jgi:hypothetical protein